MPYRLKRKEDVEPSVQRIAREQIDRARRSLAEDDPVEAIHELRKRCKKIRALLRLIRPAMGDRYTKENRRFRDLARQVADNRDDQVVLETFDTLLDHFDDRIDRRHFAATRHKLDLRFQRSLSQGASPDFQMLEACLIKAREATSRWTLDRSDFDAVAGGWQKTYERGRDALKEASQRPTTETLHDWRKRVKYHRYHCELLHNLWPRMLEVRAEEGHRLSDLLGDDHDLAVLAASLDQEEMAKVDPLRREQLAGWITLRRDELQLEAIPLGKQLFADSGKASRKRIGRYWKIAAEA